MTIDLLPTLATVFRAAHTLKGAAYTVGCAVVILFTWRVFRPGERWARALVYASLLGATKVLQARRWR